MSVKTVYLVDNLCFSQVLLFLQCVITVPEQHSQVNVVGIAPARACAHTRPDQKVSGLMLCN
jgi:hypothetical protein